MPHEGTGNDETPRQARGDRAAYLNFSIRLFASSLAQALMSNASTESMHFGDTSYAERNEAMSETECPAGVLVVRMTDRFELVGSPFSVDS